MSQLRKDFLTERKKNEAHPIEVVAICDTGCAIAATIEPRLIEFLNSGTVLHWAEIALGI